MNGELALRPGAKLPAEITDPAEAELEIRRHQAVLDVARRARADLTELVLILKRIVEYAYRGADLVDEMRVAGELVAETGGRPKPPEVREVLTWADLKPLDSRRVAEWRSLRDHGALAFLDEALASEREETLRKASLNWVRERVERKAREAAAEKVRAVGVVPDPELRHGDLREVLDDLEGQVDAIICDPPYGADALDEFDALAQLAARLLAPQGVLAAMVGQSHLPVYLERLGAHLTYRWCGAYLTEGPATRIPGRKVATKWKPILIFDLGAHQLRSFVIEDVFVSDAEDKRLHDWGQSESGMAEIVRRLTDPGELVVDPFLGGGTTAAVCRELGRRFVGCDVDAAAVAVARERMA